MSRREHANATAEKDAPYRFAALAGSSGARYGKRSSSATAARQQREGDMAQQTASEKDMYLGSFEREYQTTLRCLKAFPPDKADLKPSPKSKSARDLAWMMVLNQMVTEPVLKGNVDPSSFPVTQPPAAWPDLVTAFEKAHGEAATRITALTDDAMNAKVKMPVGPKQMGEMRRGEALWYFLSDTVHHRGQFSVYMRLAGAKVPSIYGPSADEPWF
jgi:uncharacterized damage-inducible protein DinB